ncbi:ABC transporter permease [Propionicicella superfundia]|uniref:ABC transporter permease n=1 Tax=Propionicicella superfundia TaxID=348582 RepID=UPI00041E77E3|nr:ABC transporter permease [Propionicicella superfundia]
MNLSVHNVGRVIRFEVTRTLRKPTFWALSLAVPLLFGAVFGLVYFSSSSTESAATAQSEQRFDFTYTDASGIVDPHLAAAMGGREVTDGEAALADVRAGTSTAYFAFPAEPATQATRVYGQDAGLFDSGKYASVAQALIKASVAQRIGDPELATLAAAGVDVQASTYRDGVPTGGILSFLAPMVFLVLFYLSIMMLGNQMLNVTLEEKENRVTEMILTTIRPTSLIVGKVVALVIVGIIQGLVFSLPVIVALAVMPGLVDLPDVDLSALVIDPGRMVVGGLLFGTGFLMFTGLLVAIGSVMPSAKEAGSAFAVVIVSLFLPFYAVAMLIAEPRGTVAQIFTYFPLTAPVTAMLRNAAGALDWWEALIVLVELFVFAAALLAVGVRLFRTGSISYNARLDVRKALGMA